MQRHLHRLLSTLTTTCLPADYSDKQDSTTTRSCRPVREFPARRCRRVWLATSRSETQGNDTEKLLVNRAGRGIKQAKTETGGSLLSVGDASYNHCEAFTREMPHLYRTCAQVEKFEEGATRSQRRSSFGSPLPQRDGQCFWTLTAAI